MPRDPREWRKGAGRLRYGGRVRAWLVRDWLHRDGHWLLRLDRLRRTDRPAFVRLAHALGLSQLDAAGVLALRARLLSRGIGWPTAGDARDYLTGVETRAWWAEMARTGRWPGKVSASATSSPV